MKILAVITDTHEVKKILKHLVKTGKAPPGEACAFYLIGGLCFLGVSKGKKLNQFDELLQILIGFFIDIPIINKVRIALFAILGIYLITLQKTPGIKFLPDDDKKYSSFYFFIA